MDNDLNLHNIQLIGDVGSWGVSVRDIENEFRNLADIMNELTDTVFTGDIIFSSGNDNEPIYSVSKSKVEPSGSWIEDDGREICEFLDQFKIIE